MILSEIVCRRTTDHLSMVHAVAWLCWNSLCANPCCSNGIVPARMNGRANALWKPTHCYPGLASLCWRWSNRMGSFNREYTWAKRLMSPSLVAQHRW